MAEQFTPKASEDTQWKILIIEDDEDDYLITREMLTEARGRKFEIHWAATYEEGQQELQSQVYHAVLVDYDLGLHTGIELIRETNERGYASPLILFTGRGTYETDVEAMEAGATMYLTKGEVSSLLLERAIRYAIERKQVEADLRHSEEKFATAFQNNPTAMTITRQSDGLYTEANQSFCQLVGYTREEIVGRTALELGIFSQELLQALGRQFREEGSIHGQEIPLTSRDGGTCYVLFSIDPIVVNAESSIIVTMIDITERKRTEEALRLSEERFNRAFNANPDAMLITRMENGQIETVNDSFVRCFGYQREELIGKTVKDIHLYVNPEDRSAMIREVRARHFARNLEFDLYTKTLEVRHVNTSVETLKHDGEVSLLTVYQDITEQKQLQQKNLEQKDLLERVIQSAPAGIAFMQGPEHVFTVANPEFQRFASGKGELIGRTVDEIWPEVIEIARPQYDRVYQTGEPISMVDAPFMLNRDGVIQENYFTYTHSPVYRADGSIEGVLTLAVETTQAVINRRKAEAQSAQLEAVLRALPVGVWITNPQGRIIGKNEQADRIWAGNAPLVESVEQYHAYRSWDAASGKELETEDFPLTRALHSRQPVGPVEMRIQRFDDSLGYVLVSAVPILDAQGQLLGAVAINLDITERKQTEQDLRENRARLNEFIESTHNNYITLDHQWRFTYANPHYGNTMESDPLELIGKNYWEVFPHYAGTELERNYRKVMKERVPMHYRQEGIYTHSVYDVFLYPIQEGMAIFSIDRTEEIHHQQQLEAERARLKAVLQALPVAVWITDADGNVAFQNEQTNRIWDGDAPLSKGVDQYQEYVAWFAITGKPVAAEEFPVARALRTGEPVGAEELRIRRFDGSEGMVLAMGAPIKDAQGRVTGAVAINVDLTETRRAETARRESESKYQAIFQNAPYALVLAHLSNDLIVDVNPAWQKLFGFSREEAVGKTAVELGTVADPQERERGYQEMQAHGRLHDFEMRYRARTGREMITLNNAEVIEISGVRYLLSATEDVTERKLAELKLRDSEALLRNVLESTHDTVFLLDRDWRFQFVNRRFIDNYKQFGDPFIGKSLWDIFPRYTGTLLEQHYRQVMEERVPVHFEYESAYGESYYAIGAYPSSEGIAVFAQDRTEERRAQRALQESRERLERAQEIAHLGSWELDLVHDQLAWSDEAYRIFGFLPHEIAATYETFLACVHPDDRAAVDAAYSGSIKNNQDGYEIEHRIVHARSGEIRSVHEKCEHQRDSSGQIIRSIGMVHDITERKQAEALLQKSNADLQAALAQAEQGQLLLEGLLDNIPEGISITGGPPDFRVEYISRYGRELTRDPSNPGLIGMPAGQHQDAWGLTLADGVTRPAAEQMPLYRASHFGEVIENQEMVLHKLNGERFSLLVNAAPILDKQGHILGALNSWRDITDRKRTEEYLRKNSEALRKSEEKFAKSFRSSPVAIAISTVADGRYVEINDSYTQLFGFSREELIGHTSREMGLFPDPKERQEVVRRFQQGGGFRNYEIQLLTKSGELRDLLFSTERIEIEGQECMLSLVIDITDRKRSEAALQEYADKLKRSNQELEQFAFIASHDLQEPLRKIIQFGNYLRRQIQQSSLQEAENSLGRMQNAATRMQKMIQGLLELSRVSSRGGDFTNLRTSEIIKEVASDLEPRLKTAHGRVEIADLPNFQGDEMQIRQLFQNLIGNSIKFHKPEVPPVVRLSGKTIREDGIAMAEIQVSDNGIGFDPQYAQQIFQPFQRLHSRTEFEGTGLGLAICQKIVDRHHGKIEVVSQPGEGTTFTIRLPLTAAR